MGQDGIHCRVRRSEPPDLSHPARLTSVSGRAGYGAGGLRRQSKRQKREINVAIAEGTVLDGRYCLGPVIGRGGMSEVHDGRDLQLERPVAVKLLRMQHLDDPHLGRHFEEELNAVKRLAHPHIVEVFDIGETGRRPYLVMERLIGADLACRLRAGPLDQDELRQVASELLGALDAAHAGGILHGDIKPSNILFSTEGSTKVADFGIANVTDHLSSGPPREPTATTLILGAPAYLAPERFKGLPATPRSDLWSVGVVLYQAVAGVKPFLDKDAGAVANAVVHNPAVPLDWWRPELDRGLLAAVHRALEKRPEERFASAGEMASAIGVSIADAPTATSEDRVRTEELDTVARTGGTVCVTERREPQNIVYGLVRRLVSDGRAPLLGGATLLAALVAVCVVLIAGPKTGSDERRAIANSPTTTPVISPTTARVTSPPTTPAVASPATTAPATSRTTAQVAPPSTTSPVTSPTTIAQVTSPSTTSPATSPTTAGQVTSPSTTPVVTSPTATPLVTSPTATPLVTTAATTTVSTSTTSTPASRNGKGRGRR